MNIDRRSFLGLTAAAAAAVWVPLGVTACAAPGSDPAFPVPPDFPGGIELYRQAYRNWCGNIRFDELWTAAPATAAEVVRAVNWAHGAGYKVRAVGGRHGWSPLTVEPGSDASRVVLLDTTRHLNTVDVDVAGSRVTAGAGAFMDDVEERLVQAGLAIPSVPATGGMTVGGAVTIDAHGPVAGTAGSGGIALGSVSNRVLEFDAVVWDDAAGEYVLRTFTERDTTARALLTHLGRTIMTRITVAADPVRRVRCQSYTDVPNSELFGTDPTAPRSFQRLLDEHGAVESIWFPFTDTPWLKVWTVSPEKPASSVEVTGPYNYPFSDSLELVVSEAISEQVRSGSWPTPDFTRLQLQISRSGLEGAYASDLWGWSTHVLRYIRATTLRVDEGGGALLCRRQDVQLVVSRFMTWYQDELAAEAAKGRFPMSGPVEIRCSGVDDELGDRPAPLLSALRSRPDHPEWDTAVWMDGLTIPGTDGQYDFYRRMEQFIVDGIAADVGVFRPEWAKSWAFTPTASWADPEFLEVTIPATFSEGYAPGTQWQDALAAFDAADPHRVMANSFHDRFMPRA